MEASCFSKVLLPIGSANQAKAPVAAKSAGAAMHFAGSMIYLQVCLHLPEYAVNA